jgi:hypothetical protein
MRGGKSSLKLKNVGVEVDVVDGVCWMTDESVYVGAGGVSKRWWLLEAVGRKEEEVGGVYKPENAAFVFWPATLYFCQA